MDNTLEEISAASSPPKAAGPKPKPNRRRRCIISSIIIAFVFLVLAGAIIAVVFRNRNSNKLSEEQLNTVPIFRLDSTNVSIRELSSSQLSSTWDIGFSVQNPTATRVFYQRMDLSLYYKQQQLLAKATLPTFLSDGGQGWKPVKAKLETSGSPVSGAGVLQDLQAEIASGSANFNMVLYAGYYIGGQSADAVWSAVEASCSGVQIEFSSAGRQGTLDGSGMMWRITKRW